MRYFLCPCKGHIEKRLVLACIYPRHVMALLGAAAERITKVVGNTWPQSTRLETRTKECNTHASRKVE
jgi:hypothetical protein